METIYILHFDSHDYQLKDDDILNWDEIRCSCKRESFGGVVRSFTSKFQFVNRAAELLWNEYLKHIFNSNVVLEVRTMTDRWEFVKQFECPLDFSTIERENGTVSVNAVDNSLAALIKAAKGTKYELLVGSDVPTSKTMLMTRIPMKENLTYGFTQGTSNEDSEEIRVTFGRNELPWVGNKGDETVINKTIDWRDDQDTEPGSYILKAVKDVSINFSWNYRYRNNKVSTPVSFTLKVKRSGNVAGTYYCGACSPSTLVCLGTFSDYSELPDLSEPIWEDETHSKDLRDSAYAVVGNYVWKSVRSTGSHHKWENSNKTVSEYFVQSTSGSCTIQLKARDILYMEHSIPNTNYDASVVTFINSMFLFEWMAVDESVDIGVITPKKLARSILNKIAGECMNVHVYISVHDPRIANTYIMAAETLRNISGAKLYTSFNEFCDWMSTVFGYVYFIGETKPPKYSKHKNFGSIGSPSYAPAGTYAGSINESNIHYNPATCKFFYSSAGGGYYDSWSGDGEYNDSTTGHPRTDTVFHALGVYPNRAYTFPEYSGEGNYRPMEYDTEDDEVGPNDKTVYFVHRSELMRPDHKTISIESAKGVKYSVDSGIIYSTVIAGYDKKDYESVNGRDEFNFNNTYSTGCSVSDKTLSLLSKYRADSYGIEFALQKRAKDTTDSTSDKDVFFVLCAEENGRLVPDKSCPIVNSISNAVFNGAFSPMACVNANAGYIGIQSDMLTLKFASSTGNSDIVIDGISMSSDITIDKPLATAGTIEFTTGDIEVRGDENELIEVVSEDGILYRGYIKEADLKYAREEAAKYKLIVKDIEL